MSIKNLFISLYVRKNIRFGLKIGSNYYIHSRVDFGSEPYLITIGNHVRITEGVKFVTHDGGIWIFRNEESLRDIDLFGPITIGDNVHIGTNAIIMPNVTIGDNVIIGCGSIVTKDVPSNSVVAGVPAKVIESIEEYKQKHANDFIHSKSYSPKKKKRILIERFFNKNKN